jgi:hypothetical protein
LIHRFQTERPAHAFTAVSFAQQFIVAGCRSLCRCMAWYHVPARHGHRSVHRPAPMAWPMRDGMGRAWL